MCAANGHAEGKCADQKQNLKLTGASGIRNNAGLIFIQNKAVDKILLKILQKR